MLLYGHRGSPRKQPENTIIAFAQALSDGADGFELDLQVAADDSWWVLHDETLDRTTSGHGRLKETTSQELTTLGVLSLTTFLDWLPQGVVVNLEIKGDPSDAALQAMLATTSHLRAIYSSFSSRTCQALQQRGARVGYLFADNLQENIDFAQRESFYAIHPEHHLVQQSNLYPVVNVWTVDEPARALELIKYGVAGIITNVPDKIKKSL